MSCVYSSTENHVFIPFKVLHSYRQSSCVHIGKYCVHAGILAFAPASHLLIIQAVLAFKPVSLAAMPVTLAFIPVYRSVLNS